MCEGRVPAYALAANLFISLAAKSGPRCQNRPTPLPNQAHAAKSGTGSCQIGPTLPNQAQRTHLHDREVAWQVQREPGVLPDLRDGDALQGVHQQHARDEVARACWSVCKRRGNMR